MRLVSEFLVKWPGTAYQQANSEISNRITQGAGTNVGGSYIHPCAEGVNAGRLEVSLAHDMSGEISK